MDPTLYLFLRGTEHEQLFVYSEVILGPPRHVSLPHLKIALHQLDYNYQTILDISVWEGYASATKLSRENKHLSRRGMRSRKLTKLSSN
jgi:hypothetical protein